MIWIAEELLWAWKVALHDQPLSLLQMSVLHIPLSTLPPSQNHIQLFITHYNDFNWFENQVINILTMIRTKYID